MKAHIEHIGTANRESFLCRRFTGPTFDHPFHYHPEIEITYIEKSRGSLIVGDAIGNFAPGKLYLLGENLPHIFRNTTRSATRAVSEVLHFPRDCARGFIDETPELSPIATLLDRAKRGLSFDQNTATRARNHLVQLRQQQGSRRWIIFLELLNLLAEGHETTAITLASAGYARDFGVESSEKIRRACQIILQRFDEPLHLHAVAEELNISPAYFSRLFKKATRRTYTAFLTEVRLGHACRLLTETEQTIVEIAFHSGFHNLSNFNRRFRHSYACSPREYRSQHHFTELPG